MERGRMLTGIYAPIRKPIKALNTPVKEAAAEVWLKKAVKHMTKMTAESEDKTKIPNNSNKLAAEKVTPLETAKKTKAIIRKIKLKKSVIKKALIK